MPRAPDALTPGRASWARVAGRALLAVLLLALGSMAAALAVGELLSRPAHRSVGAPPAELGAQSVTLDTRSGTAVGGWFAEGRPQAGAVLLLHGVRGDRRAMLGRALALRRDGYAVLLIDLPSHGESQGDRIGFGLREAEGVAAALDFLRRRLPQERIGVIGVSLGAAALVLARPVAPPAAVVLESPYASIEEAVQARLAMRLGATGEALAPLLLWQLPLRLGVTQQDLRPVDALPLLQSPVLIVAGEQDLHAPPSQARSLFDAARAPKALWTVPGAAHVDLFDFGREAYRARVFTFLDRHLRGPAAGPTAARTPSP